VIESEYLDLRGTTKANKVTQGFEKVGLCPFRTNNKMWNEWINRVKVVQRGLEVTYGAEEQDYLVPRLKHDELVLTDDEKLLIADSS
jgi:hypothetical protein